MFKYLSSLFLAVALLFAAQAPAQTFAHYAGASGKPLASNGMQQVAEYEYYVYINGESSDYTDKTTGIKYVYLKLPMQYYTDTKTFGNETEPKGYFRWYDYNTDKGTSKLGKYQSAYNVLTSISDAEGNARGLFAYNLNKTAFKARPFAGPHMSWVGAWYINKTANESNWKGDDIACDVSRYIDYNDKTTPDASTFTHEPTLSVRYIFHIRPAKVIADSSMNAALGKVEDQRTMEDYKHTVFGVKDNDATVTIRLANNAVGDYWFYPMNNFMKHHVFATDDAHKIVASDFSSTTTPVKATQIMFREYDPTWKYYRQVQVGTSTTLDVSVTTMNNTSWANIEGSTQGVTAPKINIGDKVYLVAYAMNGTNYCPIANWTIHFTSQYPKQATEFTDADNERTTEYRKAHFKQSTDIITFDNVSTDMTKAAPTSPSDNISSTPKPFETSNYGFVYKNLLAYSWGHNSDDASNVGNNKTFWDDPGYSPLHGEYAFYKSANLSGVSQDVRQNNASRYLWYWPSNTLYDRTHERDNALYGHFFYVDASDEPRDISYEDFTGNLCTGSELYVSAWVADMTTSDGTKNGVPNNTYKRPQVFFRLYGLDKDPATGAVISQKLLGSIASGDLYTNGEGKTDYSGKAKWYQVYGAFVLDKASNADNFSDFRVAISNGCSSTMGADYAVDDIEIYQRTAKVKITQDPPACPDDDLSKGTPEDIRLKMKIDYETIQALAEGKTKLFFRFVDASTNQPTTTVNYNYNTGTAKYDYGVATIPATYSAAAKIADGLADNDSLAFEMSSDGDIDLILCNRYFNIDPAKSYYVSMALAADGDDATTVSWGSEQNGVCSIYSGDLKIIQQVINVYGSDNSNEAQVTVGCSDTNVTNYSIKCQVNTSDQENGGSINLTVPFDWYIGSRQEFIDNGLLEPLQHFREAYPTATDLTGGATGNYTADDKTTLEKYIFDSTHSDGKLLLLNSTTLTGYPFIVGEHTVCAMPTQPSVKVGAYTYNLCDLPMEMTVTATKQGVGLELGMKDIIYPSSAPYRSLRLGLPQIRDMQKNKASLKIPVQKRKVNQADDSSADLLFVPLDYQGDEKPKAETAVYLLSTNDPKFKDRSFSANSSATEWTSKVLKIATLDTSTLSHNSTTLDMKFEDGIADVLHEGYQYVFGLNFTLENTTTENPSASVTCPGNTRVILKIVPEYLTWNPATGSTATANWNTDANWRRSTAAELYKSDYVDYGTATYHLTDATTANQVDAVVTTQNTYVPMSFTKVTIPQLSSGRYPLLGNIVYDNRGLATSMANDNNEAAQSDIQYEMEAEKESGANNYGCVNFKGNLCDQVYFKPEAQMMNQQYLVYNQAWMEYELGVDVWNSITVPMKDIYGGDFYAPYLTGRQETEAFQPITWSATDNSRSKYPFYQRAWGTEVDELSLNGSYTAWDSPTSLLPLANGTSDGAVTGWSHVYNQADKAYAVKETNGDNYMSLGLSLRVGDAYMPNTASGLRDNKALVRLPKADTQYTYQDVAGTASEKTVTVSRNNNYKLLVDMDNSENAMGTIKATPSVVQPTDNNHYYLVGNPYVNAIAVSRFLSANASALEEQKVWVLRDNVIYELPATNAVSSSTDAVLPGEAFFVKMSAPQTLTFTKLMQVESNVKSGTAATAAAKPIFVTYALDGGAPTDIASVLATDEGDLKTWNPATGQLAVSYAGSDALVSLSVYTLDGRLWQVLRPQAATTYVQIPAGVYLVKGVTKKGSTKVKKQIVN